MKSMKVLKKLVVIMLSLVIMLACSNAVFAADDDLFTEIPETNTSTNNTTNNGTNNTNTPITGNNSNTSSTNNTNTSNNSNASSLSINNSSNTNNTNSNTNRSVSNSNALANTGLAQAGGIVALIVVVCGISAIYSYKKVNDYKNL